MKVLDLTGQRFGRLKVLRRNGLLSNGKEPLKAWLCKCDCGKHKTIRGRDLKTGNTSSCGCLAAELKHTYTYKHGKTGSPLYKLWSGIKQRCSVKNKGKNRKIYENIKICTDWSSFEKFYEWAKNKYKKGLDIDRIDTFKGYSPDNCRFVTRKENTQNTKRSKWWYVHGKKFSSAGDAANYLGVVQSTIVSWCMGKKSGKYSYPPKKNCYAIKKYGGNDANN